MNDKIIATIDISRPAGRKLVCELKRKRTVKLEYPVLEETTDTIAEEKIYTHEEVWNEMAKRFNEHYGTNISFL